MAVRNTDSTPVRKCPRCRREARDAARFCARCGLMLDGAKDGSQTAGRIPHQGAASPPAGFARCADAADLHFRWESVSGGACIGAEPLAVHLFNGGYALSDVRVEVIGHDEAGLQVFCVEQGVPDLPAGRPLRLEIPSYEVSRRVYAVTVRLLSAEFLWQE